MAVNYALAALRVATQHRHRYRYRQRTLGRRIHCGKEHSIHLRSRHAFVPWKFGRRDLRIPPQRRPFRRTPRLARCTIAPRHRGTQSRAATRNYTLISAKPLDTKTLSDSDTQSDLPHEEFDWSSVVPSPDPRHAIIEALTSTLSSAVPTIANNTVLEAFELTSLLAAPDAVGPVLQTRLGQELRMLASEAVTRALQQASPELTLALASSNEQAARIPTDARGGNHTKDRCCPECSKTMSYGSWYDHVRSGHTGSTCRWPGCHVATASERELRHHLRDHHRDALSAVAPSAPEDEKHHCTWPGCTKTTGSKDRIYMHLYEHQVLARREGDAALNGVYAANFEVRGLMKDEDGDDGAVGEVEDNS
ncbi:Uu.00g091880.m01.CDS01 [Anthostomella pinea]|uniref:Uu.00g091880.m01.CDS01 n=1 Tax=Anthostomella pinea TaxID=933095 RepID=A0AAI8VNT5_9PEZI|nr:Uu.00g091880.m01.CDS01 [Anthostomella pinea]